MSSDVQDEQKLLRAREKERGLLGEGRVEAGA